MIRPIISLAALTALCACLGSTRGAGALPPAARFAADETHARATLAQNAIELDLPLTGPAAEGARLTAWVLSPGDVPSGETAAAIAAGSRSAHVVLPWPKDEHGKPAEEIGWYRIGYRIEANGAAAAQGILSVGAIAPNLLALRLAKPQTLITGVPISVRVFAGNPVTRQPFRGVQLKATLTFDEDDSWKAAKQPIARTATTGANGEAIFSFPGPPKPGQDATLKVEGTLTGTHGEAAAFAHASLESDLEAHDLAIFHPETDKPLHKPGETVHLRTLVFDNSGHAAIHVPLTLAINDPDNETLLKVPLTTNQFGIASYDWKTGPQLATGDYEANFDDDDSSSYGENAAIRLSIERYELPEFLVTAAMDHGFYLAGQTPLVKIHAGYLFGKPVAAGSVKVFRTKTEGWDWRRNRADESETLQASGTLDADGDASFPLDIKSDFSDFAGKQYERFIDLQYRAIVMDASTGRSEPRRFTVRLTRDPVHIYLGPSIGDGREGDVLVSTSYADGAPVSCKVELDWMDAKDNATRAATAETNRYGLAKVHLRYPALGSAQEDREVNVRVIARDPQGRVSRFDDVLRPSASEAPWLTVARSLLRPGEPIQATVHGAPGDLVDLDVLSEKEVLAHLQVRLRHKAEPVTIVSDSRFHGLVSIRAYRMNRDETGFSYWLRDGGSESVLYPEDRELRVKLSGIKTSYPPGAAVDANLRVSNAAGAPIAGAVGVTVFDSAVAQRAETEEEENNRWFGERWWIEGPQAGGLTLSDLNRVDTQEPIADDLELAAEAVLENVPTIQIEIEETSDATIRDEYRTAMEQRLKPLGEAIAAVRVPHLPGTFGAVQQVAKEAHLDSVLRDPWNTPYKVETSDEGTRERVGFRSAGPDKQFGTGDDLELDVAQRNLFSIPGEQLSKLLTHAAKTSRALPANLDQLKALAAEEGLDLDSDSAGTRAPDSKPYKYEIDIHRCFYSVRVYRANDEEVWSSPYIDYFSSTEARMESALQAWTGAGKAFPATEAEARQAFSAAGIDFDALRDPLGRSFQLRATQLLVYTMNEQVKAGGELHVQSKPVTQLMRAVQILRSPDAAQGESAETADLVTQFLHPLSEQSGSDMKPQPADHGTFKGNSGAIGGTVTDQTGAVVARAVVTVKDASGTETMGTTEANGMYLVNGLAPGIYRLNVRARGFEDFSVYEIRVSAASLTTVDITLRVGAETETVTVAADAMPMMATASAQVSVSRGVLGPGKKTLVSGPGGRAEISEPTFTPRLRHVFDETAYWAPSLETNANGSTRLSFHLPDSLTTWNLRALASTSDGRAGALDETFKTFQPFFIDLDAPQALTQGDEIVLPVNLRNYTAQSLALPITVKAADWLQPLTPLSQRITVPAGATAPVHFGFRAAGTVDEGPLRITAANGREGDAVEKIVRVHPDGRPESVTASGLLRGTSTTLSVDLPAGLIPGSIHAQLLLFPSIGAQLVHSIQASLERPYGCAEQTISSAYPSLLFLEMLKASKSNSALETKAQTYLQLGADRLRDYFDASGGLTYWGGSDHAPDPALTAYGIEFLMEAGPFVHVDPDRVTRAARWLMAAQKEDGSWAPRYGEPNAELTLYVARMLERVASDSEYGSSKDLKDGLQAAIARALDRADHSASAVHDVYANAIRLEIAIARSDAPSIQRLHDELVSTAVRDREGAHWPRDGYSPFYGWGRAGAIEAAAVAYSALEDRSSETDGRLLNDVLFFLLRSRDNYGIWYSGQATVRVLKALLPVAVRQIAAPAGAAGFNLAVNGAPIDAASASQLRADTQLIDAPRSLDLTALLRPGHNELVFSGTNEAALASAEVSASFYTPWSTEDETKTAQTTTGRDYGLDFGYRCDLTDAKVGKPIGCSVTARRFGSQSYGMLLAEVGLPPGADVDRASLGKLLDNWTISRYELQPDRIVFYLWSWSAEGSHFSFRFTPRYAIRAKAAPSALTDYYNPDLQAVLAPQLFDVK